MSLSLAASLLVLGHTAGLSGGEYVVRDGALFARLSFQRGELQAWLDAAGGDVARALAVQLLETARPCAPERFRLEPEEEDGQRVRFEARCAFPSGARVVLRLGFLERAADGHRHFYEAKGGGSPVEGVAYHGASELRFAAASAARPAWLGWALPAWLVLGALGLGAGTRRRAAEVAAVAGVTSLLLVGVGAATAFGPQGPYLDLLAPLFAFYLAAEAYFAKTPPRRAALAVPGGMLVALLLLGADGGDGAAEDRVVRGLVELVSLGLVPGLGLLAILGAVSVRAGRVTAAAVALAAAARLVASI